MFPQARILVPTAPHERLIQSAGAPRLSGSTRVCPTGTTHVNMEGGKQLRTVIPAPPGHHVFAMTPIKLLLAQLPLETLQLTSGSQAQKGHWFVISFT